MDTSLTYNFFNSDEDAIKVFNICYVNDDEINDSYIEPKIVFNTCFGSYPNAFRLSGSSLNKDFYFALTSDTDSIERAIEAFNSEFKNIQFRIVATARLTEIYQLFHGFKTTTEKGLKVSLENPDISIRKTSTKFLLNIVYSKEYNDFSKYVLRIPLGFFIRIFSNYVGSPSLMNRIPAKEKLIELTLKYSNESDTKSILISDYIVSKDLFMMFDNPELMNTYFKLPYAKVPYLDRGSTSSIILGSMIEPYSVYWLIEHKGVKKYEEYNIKVLKTLQPETLRTYYGVNDLSKMKQFFTENIEKGA